MSHRRNYDLSKLYDYRESHLIEGFRVENRVRLLMYRNLLRSKNVKTTHNYIWRGYSIKDVSAYI